MVKSRDIASQCTVRHRLEFSLLLRRIRLSKSVLVALIAVSDAAIVATCYLISYNCAIAGANHGPFTHLMLMPIAIGTSYCFVGMDLYSSKRLILWPPDFSHILRALILVHIVFLSVLFVSRGTEHIFQAWITVGFLTSIIGVTTLRAGVSYVCRQLSSVGLLRRNVAVFGVTEQAAKFIRTINYNNMTWISIVGVFDERCSRLPATLEGRPIDGGIQELEDLIRGGMIDEIFFALPWNAEDRLIGLTGRLHHLPVQMYLASDLLKYRFPALRRHFYTGLPVLEVLRPPLHGHEGTIKALIDCTIALVLLILLSPLLLAVAVAIKRDSAGPVLFCQKRYGYNNTCINVLKFRTMYSDKCDENAETLVTIDDTRITRVGHVLRRTSIDELPQLINVLRGEMSLVGPRPHATRAKAAGRLYEEIVREYAARHRVKPGITGLAQVNGFRGETDTEEKIVGRIKYDIEYIDNWSLWLDVRILVLTLFVPFQQDNAY